MSTRITRWLAWSVGVFAATVFALGLLFTLLNAGSPAEGASYPVPFLVFAVVGSLVAWHRPGNAIGWIFCVVGASNVLWYFATQYMLYTFVTRPGSLPGGAVAAWLSSGWVASIGWGLMAMFVLLLFPTGRLLSRRWRPVAWYGALFLALMVTSQAIRPGPVHPDYPLIRNPLGVERAAGFADLVFQLYPLVLPVIIAGGISVVLRFRRAKEDERQQLKWFGYATSLLLGTYALNFLADLFGGIRIPDVVWVLPVAALPTAAGVAILKYRLYDIDILVNRTLVYGALTASLAAIYLGGVVLLQWLLRIITGQQNSQLAVVASTLGIAALFQPLRRRIQGFIDHRFYRRKYDASRTLQEFSVGLRDEVDLERIGAGLLTVVDRTMRPSHISLWLREPGSKR